MLQLQTVSGQTVAGASATLLHAVRDLAASVANAHPPAPVRSGNPGPVSDAHPPAPLRSGNPGPVSAPVISTVSPLSTEIDRVSLRFVQQRCGHPQQAVQDPGEIWSRILGKVGRIELLGSCFRRAHWTVV